MLSGRWLFVRHGESIANAEGWLAGHADVGLSERGRAQAQALVGRWPERPDRIFVSDLQRARETASIALAGHAEPVVSPRLRERHLGMWEGAYKAHLKEQGHWERLLAWEQGPPGGEAQREVAIRMLGWLEEHDAVGVTAVIGHGTALRTVLGLLDGIPPDEIGWSPLGNGELIVRVVPLGTWAKLRAGLERA